MKKLSLILSMLIIGLAMSTSLMAQNNCLEFDGTDDNVSCGTISLSGSAITLEAWIKPGSFKIASPYISNIVGEEVSPGQVALLRLGDASLANNKLQFVLSIGGAETKLDGETALSADVWYHVAATYDGSNMRIYINGIEDASKGQTGSFTANTTFYISDPGDGTRCFDGQIDEVRVWNIARSQTNFRQCMYREIPNEASMVSYYKFNETSGTSLPDSKGSNDGTLSGYGANGIWQTSPAMFGPKYCLDFDGGLKTGSPDYASKNSNVTTNVEDFTMMAWIKPDVVINGTNGWRCVAYNGDDAGGYGFGISATKVTGLFGAITYHITGEVLSVGNWYHITMRRSSNTVQFFLNGKLLSYSDTDNTDPDSPSAKFSIGNMYSNDGSTIYTDSFDGQIDEVRVYDAALTNQQIRENMCKTLTGIETNLVAYYNFDNTSGTTLQSFDGSTSNDLTLVNTGDDDWVSSTAFNTWLNTSSSSWSTTTNWSRGSLPGASDNVGIVDYVGGTAPSLSGNPILKNLIVDDTFILTSGVTINNNLIIESDLDLNGQTIILGASANLMESSGHLTGTSGTIQTTRDLSNIDEDVAGLGAEITEDGNLGSCTILRGVQAQGTLAIKRYYQITTANSPTNATLVFNYLESELNGQTESALKLFKSSDGSTWAEQSSNAVNTTDNTITLTGIDAFSYWTAAPAGSDASLPVELTSFTAAYHNGGVLLEWSTESEIENLGFILERRKQETGNWNQVVSYLSDPTLEGHGSTTEAHEYQYVDKAVQPGVTYEYRLGDVDYNGKVTWHGKLEVKVKAESTKIPVEFGLQKAYPNPFNPAVTLSYGLKEDGQATLQVFNLRGQLVETLVSAYQLAGTYDFTWQPVNLGAGVYIIRFQSGNKTNLQKVVFVK